MEKLRMSDNLDLREGDVAGVVSGWLGGRISRREALRRLGVLGLGLPVGSALLAACSSTPAATKSSTKSKAVIGIIQEPTSMDPTADATASIATCLRDNLYEGLVRLDGSGKITPALAKSWDVSGDGTTVTFHLATGVKWHDGSSFSAQDVKFSWDRAKDTTTKPV